MVHRLLDGFPLGYLKSQHKYFGSSVLMLLHSKAINLRLSEAGSCLLSLTKRTNFSKGISNYLFSFNFIYTKIVVRFKISVFANRVFY